MRIQKTTKHCLNDEQRLLILKRFLNLFSDNLFLRHTGFWKYLTWRFPPWLEPFSFVLCTLYYLWTSYFSFIPFFNNMRWRNTVVSFGAQGSKPFNKRHPPIHLLPPIGNSLFQALTCVMENFWLLWQNDPWFWWRILDGEILGFDGESLTEVWWRKQRKRGHWTRNLPPEFSAFR